MSSTKINPRLLCPFVHISRIFRPLKFCFSSSSQCLPNCWIQWQVTHWISLSITWNWSLFGFSDTALPWFLSHLSDHGVCLFQELRLLDWLFKICFFPSARACFLLDLAHGSVYDIYIFTYPTQTSFLSFRLIYATIYWTNWPGNLPGLSNFIRLK